MYSAVSDALLQTLVVLSGYLSSCCLKPSCYSLGVPNEVASEFNFANW